jgi:hypothetical protein
MLLACLDTLWGAVFAGLREKRVNKPRIFHERNDATIRVLPTGLTEQSSHWRACVVRLNKAEDRTRMSANIVRPLRAEKLHSEKPLHSETLLFLHQQL